MSATPSKAPDAAHGKEKAVEGSEVKKDDEIARAAAETKAKVDEATKHKPAKEVLADLKKAPDAAKKKEVIEGLHLSVEEAKKDDLKKEFKDAVKGESELEALIDKKFHDAAHPKAEEHGKDHGAKHDDTHGDAHGGDHAHGHAAAHDAAHDAKHDDGHAEHPVKVSYGFAPRTKDITAANDNREDETKPPGVIKSFATPVAVPTKTAWQLAKSAGAFGIGMVPFLGKWFMKNYQGPKLVKVKLPVKEPESKKAKAAHSAAHEAAHGAEHGHDAGHAANDNHEHNASHDADHGHEEKGEAVAHH